MTIRVTVDGTEYVGNLNLSIVDGEIEGDLSLTSVIEEDINLPKEDEELPDIPDTPGDEEGDRPPGLPLLHNVIKEFSKFGQQRQNSETLKVGAIGDRKAIVSRTDFSLPPTKAGGNKYRNEFTHGHLSGLKPQRGKAYRIKFDVWIPKDQERDTGSHIIWQWHGRPDFDKGESWRNPTLGIYSDCTGNLRFFCNYDPSEGIVTKNKKSQIYAVGRIEQGKWETVEIEFLLTHKMGEGWARAYINGKAVGTMYTGATVWNDAQPGYYKIGGYYYAISEGKKRKWGNYPVPDTITYGFSNYQMMLLPDNYLPK